MKERPILMNGAMVRALLDGSKTQTRRIVKPQPRMYEPGQCVGVSDMINDALVCPYGKAGDRLWVRETWRTTGDGGRADYLAPRDIQPHPVWHDADGAAPADQCTGKTRVSIHMPRWASRILLEIVSVRVERLNDCSEADARAEGVMQLDDDCSRPEMRTKEGWHLCPTCAGTGLRSTLGAGGGVNFDVDCADCDTHLKLYHHLWESINGAGSWAANEWVWAIEFKRVKP